jgi:hypothetical protein
MSDFMAGTDVDFMNECDRNDKQRSIDKPKSYNWYTQEELYQYLLRNDCPKNIAKELSKTISEGYNFAYDKGYAGGFNEGRNR